MMLIYFDGKVFANDTCVICDKPSIDDDVMPICEACSKRMQQEQDIENQLFQRLKQITGEKDYSSYQQNGVEIIKRKPDANGFKWFVYSNGKFVVRTQDRIAAINTFINEVE